MSGFDGRFGRFAGISALGLAVVLSSPGANAEPGVQLVPAVPGRLPVDTVVLHSGGIIHGKVGDILPGDHLTLAIETGETRTIPWAEVDRVIIGSGSTEIPAPPSAPVAVVPAEPPPAPVRGPFVRVHFTAPKTLQVYRHIGDGPEWVHACETPCDADLPLADEYRATGGGNGGSKPFHLHGSPGESITITIDPPSTGGMVLGGLLAGVGGVGLYYGSLFALAGAASSSDCSYDYNSCQANNSLRDTGLVMMAVSAVAMTVGFVAVVNASKTDILQHDGPSHDTAALPSQAPQAAFRRQPTWRESAGAPAQPAMTIPLLSGSF